jgi:alpha-beta hydrolase superfamily lysophospholipase
MCAADPAVGAEWARVPPRKAGSARLASIDESARLAACCPPRAGDDVPRAWPEHRHAPDNPPGTGTEGPLPARAGAEASRRGGERRRVSVDHSENDQPLRAGPPDTAAGVPAGSTRVALTSADGVELDAVLHTPAGRERHGCVVQAHGITADLNEGGMYVRLAENLADSGFTVLRFSFRGHGNSHGSQSGVTIAGEMLDLQTAVDVLLREHDGPLSIVAASFGAVPVALSLPHLSQQLETLVLWNPVLNLHRTFVEPELPWGLKNFGPRQQEQLHRQGFLLIDGEFRLGWVLFEEIKRYRPDRAFVTSHTPALVIHGDRDSYVSYEIAKEAAAAQGRCDFHTVQGSDHGFDSPEREKEAVRETVDWLIRHALRP